MDSNDRLILGMAAGGDLRILAAQTTETVETARTRCDLSPIAAKALGQALTGAVLLARLLDKNVRNQWVTLRFDGNGPLGLLLAEGTVAGNVRGYVANHTIDELEAEGSLIGKEGTLTVIRGVPPAGKPYTSQLRIQTGEVAKDIAHYLAASEQIPSAVLLGVKLMPEGVKASGGVIVQAFPHTNPLAIDLLEARIREMPSLSTMLGEMSIEEAVAKIFDGMNYKAIDSRFDTPVTYQCGCTRERALGQYAVFSRQELGEMIESGEASEAVCQFCGTRYTFLPDELLSVASPTSES